MRRSVLVMAVLVVGCTTGCGGSPESSAPNPDAAVAWVDQVCREIVELTRVQTAPSASQSLEAVDQYLAENVGAVDQTINDLQNVGSSPVAGGDDGVAALLTGLEALRKGYQGTRDKLATVDVSSPQTAQTAMVDAFGSLAQGAQELATAMRSIETNQALKDASSKASNCQTLQQTASARTASKP